MERFYEELAKTIGVKHKKSQQIVDKVFECLNEVRKPYYYKSITNEITNKVKKEFIIKVEEVCNDFELNNKQVESAKEYFGKINVF